MLARTLLSRDNRVNAVIGAGHFLSHFYALCLPTVFVAWARTFDASFAELGVAAAAMSATAGLLQTPAGFLVDRYGARPFLIGGALLMALSVAAMGLATAFWQIVVLALLSGAGNSVFHPADYAILSGSVDRSRIGRAFAFHTFNGYVGFAAAPPVTAALMLLVGWRAALITLGLLGVPVVMVILWQSHILVDQTSQRHRNEGKPAFGARFLLSRPVLSMFAFFLVSAMASAGIQSWLITILHQADGMAVTAASTVLTLYLVGTMGGILVGGWVADRTDRHLVFVVVLTVIGAALLFLVGVAPMSVAVTIGVMLGAGLSIGASRTPRDVMVKDVAPPSQIGKVFGFVSAGMSLGSAIMPVPYGFLIDSGRPRLVLVVVALLLVASLLFAGSSRVGVRRAAMPAPAE
ncbi:MAG TPA: MFS transporter [Stellaceae bacterium]|nr:MFS transporter [Stellaceae bacterium]